MPSTNSLPILCSVLVIDTIPVLKLISDHSNPINSARLQPVSRAKRMIAWYFMCSPSRAFKRAFVCSKS